MTRYIIISKKFSGFVCYGFNTDGYLIEYRNCTWGYDDKQMRGILQSLGQCLYYPTFNAWCLKYELDVRKIETDLTFETWYREYDMARDRKDAANIWGRLKTPMRLRAFWVKEAYDRYLKRFKLDFKMYPKAFLGSHLDDEFDKLKEKQK